MSIMRLTAKTKATAESMKINIPLYSRTIFLLSEGTVTKKKICFSIDSELILTTENLLHNK